MKRDAIHMNPLPSRWRLVLAINDAIGPWIAAAFVFGLGWIAYESLQVLGGAIVAATGVR